MHCGKHTCVFVAFSAANTAVKLELKGVNGWAPFIYSLTSRAVSLVSNINKNPRALDTVNEN